MNVLLVTANTLSPDLLPALEAANLMTYVAVNLEQALHALAEVPFAAVVLNVNQADMPLMCGTLRERLQTQAVRLLAVTGNDANERNTALEAGADDVLTAPLEPVELLLRLRLNASNKHHWRGAGEVLMHDLKSPLSTVISNLEFIREVLNPDATLLTLVTNALSAAHRQAFLIEDTVYYMLLKDQVWPIELEPVDLRDLVETLRSRVEEMLDKKGITLKFLIPEDMPPVLASRDLLLRVLNALIDNSLKFCTRGGEIEVESVAGTEGARLVVRDTGRPILPMYNNIFDLSLQSEARRESSRTTVGMGLPFAHVAVLQMHGDLRAFSHNGWTNFLFWLPLART